MIVSIRTDNPDAEVGVFTPEGEKKTYYTWHADRQLAKQLLRVVHDQLQQTSVDWPDVTGVVVFEGPGSFTGLRIGITVADSLAYGLRVPIVAEQTDDWLKKGLARLQAGEDDRIALPHYGAEAHITPPKR